MGSLEINIGDIQSLHGKVAIVTGGSSGIGSSIVDILFSKGCQIYNLDISELPSSSGTKATYFKTDVSQWQPQLEAFKAVFAKHGHIDYVFANAGTTEGEMAFEDKVDGRGDPIEPRWSTISINLIGVLTTVKLAIHFFRAQKIQGGSIVMTTSRTGYTGGFMPVYTTSKTGILGILRGTKHMVPKWNITINAVSPFFTLTGLTAQSIRLFEEAGMILQSPEAPALAGVYLAMNRDMNGRCIDVTEGRFREIESLLEADQFRIFGEEDTTITTEKEMAASLSVQPARW